MDAEAARLHGRDRGGRAPPAPSTARAAKPSAARLFVGAGTGTASPSVHGGDGAYRERLPSPALRAFVGRIGVYRERIAPDRTVEERVVPDGAVHLIFHLGDRPTGPAAEGGSSLEAVGASCTPALLRMAGTVDGVSVRLRAGGVAPLLGIPAGEIAGRSVPLGDLWGALGSQTLERLAETDDEGARISIVEGALQGVLSRGGAGPHAGAAHAVRRIVASGGRMRVRELAATLGVSERRLEQIFHRHVGLSPKAMCRLARFHAIVRLLQRQPGLPWPQVAHECGLYDQSHLVHEFRGIAGLTPTEFVAGLASGSSKTGG